MIAAPPEPAGKIWSAWSPQSLHPWAPPRLDRQTALVPSSFWLDHHILPLRVERVDGRQALVVAAASADVDPAVLLQLRSLVRLPVRVAPAAADDVEFWLDVLFRGETWRDAVGRSLLETLELGRRSSTPLGGDVGVGDITAAFGLPEDMAVEVLALRARLPQVRLEKCAIPCGLVGPLIARWTVEELQVVPAVLRRGFLLLASPRVQQPETMIRLAREIGFEPRLALCTPSAFQAALRLLPAGSTPAPPPPAERDLLDALLRRSIINASQHDGLLTLARLTLETPVEAASRLGYLTPEQLTGVTANLAGVLFVADAAVAANATLSAYGSQDLWRRWSCVPLQLAGQGATLGATRLLTEDVLLAANQLTGTNFQQALITEAALDQALSAVAPHRSASFAPEHYLLDAGLAQTTAELLETANHLARDESVTLAEAFHRLGIVQTVDLVEAQAIAANCPWIHLDRYPPQAGVPELIPDFWAANDQVLAFRRRGPVLSIALMNGKDELPAGLEALTGCAIEPVLGVAGDVEETFARWYRDAPAAASAEQAGFGEFLVRAGILTQAQFDADWRTSTQLARPLDAVLAARIGWDELARQVAVFLELKIVQLDLVSETHEHVDALGRLRRDTRQRDPVDAEIARRLSKDLALRARALPVARKSTTVIVAMVNPLNASDVQEIQAELGGNVQLCVAESSQMERAQRRVWSTASLGESMVLAGLIEPEDLRRAMKVHDATGVRLGQALLSLGLVTANDLAYFLAKQTGVPFFDLSGTIADPKVAGLMKPPTSGRARYLPLYQEVDGGVLLAVPDPMTPEELATARDELGIPDARQVIVTEYAFDEALDAVYRDDFHEHSASELMTREPDQSARWVLSLGQKAFLAGLVVALGAGFAVAPVATGTALMALATFFYVGFSVYKFFLAYSAMAHTLEIGTDDEEVQSLDDRFLPIYTILVPLYKESEVLPGLIKAIDRLDYPKAKLDVKLLLEEDDEETIAVARASGLPSHFKLVVVPRGLPKGKPKACNYGLIYARGEYAVIFDAEDLPERDQLKKAIVAFNKAPDEVACIQAKLNYFNRDQNLLTRWFTTEYSMWFDLFLPGLDASHAPIPLGGTSNHFRTARLRELGAWDPYNVTEDADLGVRLFKAGMKTAVIDSTTYEEANSEIYNWIRQRSRWVKGYIQTYLVHMRHPLRLIRQLGLKDFFSFQMVVGGTFFGFLANPVFWVITAGWYLFQWGWIKPLFPPLLFYLGAFNLYIGNFAFTYLNVAGCLRRRYYDMVKYALMTPIYWALMSIAAWKGFLQLFYAPSYWEKTKHGLYQGIIQAEPDKRELAA